MSLALKTYAHKESNIRDQGKNIFFYFLCRILLIVANVSSDIGMENVLIRCVTDNLRFVAVTDQGIKHLSTFKQPLSTI